MGELAHADAAQAELAEHGPRPATALAARVAPHLELRLALGLGDQRLLGHVVFVTSSTPLVRDCRALREPSVDLASLPEREAERAQQRAALVVGRRRGDHGDVHAPDLDDAVVVDLGEDQLLSQPEGEVAVPVEAPGRQPAEVADAGQRHRHQPVQELPHPVTAQRDLGADRLALADLETGDRLLGLGDLRLLPGDRGQVAHGAVELARLADGVAHAHVDHDLDRPGHTIWTLEASSQASFSVMPPVWPPRWVGRIFSCRFTRLTPSTSTLLRPGSTRSTRPLAVMSLPAITITRSSLWIFMVLQHLWRETDDLHEALVPQLAAHRAEDARATRVLLLVDDDGSVLVEADVGAVGAALLLLGAHDDRLDHVAFLDRAARDGVLHRRDDDVADGGVASPGAAEHADAQALLG